jgi:tetratricopeptide (TPR) repeat protein
MMLVAAIGIGVVAGCSPQAKTARHLARASQYVQAEKYREAAIEYMNVLQADPSNRLAVRGMGLTLYQMGEVRGAVYYLQKAEELDPADAEVRIKLGTLFLVMGDRVRARQRAEAILKGSPDNLDALVLWGAGVSTSNEVATAIGRLTSYSARFTDQSKYYVTLAALHARQGDFESAEAVYRTAIGKLPKSWELRLARGDLSLLKRDSARAGEEYQAAADLSPATSVARVKLARLRWANGKTVEAKKILDDLLKQAPRLSAAGMSRAEIAFGERDYAAALKLLDGIMKAEPSNLDAFLLIQRVKLAQGRDDEAIAAYTKLVAAFPKVAQGGYLLGMAWLHKGDVQKAIGECKRAVALDSGHREATRLLAELYIRTGQPDLALSLLKPVVDKNPGDALAHVLIGAAYSARKDYTLAADAYRNLMKNNPGNPQGPYLLGVALKQLGRDDEAIAMFEEALRLDPRSMEALEQVAGMLAVRQKKWDAEVARIRKQVEKVPDAAGFHYLLGNSLIKMKDWEAAEKSFQKAIELKPEITSAYLGLSYVYMATHKEDQALGKLGSALAVNSNDVASLMLKGTILAKRTDVAGAAAAYERVLAVNPNFVPALNNLACQYLGNPSLKEKAYDYARRAREIAPRDPRVADTLGWILFGRGEYKWALTILQESADQLAAEPEVLYHLGMCQAAAGAPEKARASLSRSLEHSKEFPGRREAADMLSVLSAGDSLAELASVGKVEDFLAKHSDNPYALVKAASFYEQAGDFSRAGSLYEKVLARNANFVPALIGLATLCADHLDQMDRALSLARQAREEAPGDPLVTDALAEVTFRKGDYQWTKSLVMESIGKAGATPGRQYLLGLIYYVQGKVETSTNLMARAQSASTGPRSAAAARFIEHVRNSGPALAQIGEARVKNALTVENLPLLMYMAGTYEEKGEMATARGLYEQAAAQYPEFSPAFEKLALAYTGKNNVTDAEFKVLARARELLPDNQAVGRALGEAAYKRGQYEWASRLLQEVVDTVPNQAGVHYYLGMSYLQLKNKDAARKALKRALELDPRAEWAPEVREMLANSSLSGGK